MCGWLIGNCREYRDEPLTQRRKCYKRGEAEHSMKSRPKN